MRPSLSTATVTGTRIFQTTKKEMGVEGKDWKGMSPSKLVIGPDAKKVHSSSAVVANNFKWVLISGRQKPAPRIQSLPIEGPTSGLLRLGSLAVLQ